jgi:hypothetical protein
MKHISYSYSAHEIEKKPRNLAIRN